MDEQMWKGEEDESEMGSEWGEEDDDDDSDEEDGDSEDEGGAAVSKYEDARIFPVCGTHSFFWLDRSTDDWFAEPQN